MHKILIVPMFGLLVGIPAHAMKPPREESPASQEALQALGAGNGDEQLQQAIASANAYPLGTLQNPIRVEGPEGAQTYLSRLRCADGSIPKIGAKSVGGVDTFGTVTDIYPVRCGRNTEAPLVFDIYNAENVETRPPAGFNVAP
jgi:hypothetical protein